uniref:Uncharacterized protein n=1 Tax=Magallana gigas TaxID=29159 RepID=A0A8W8M2X4_MAGGI
MTTYGYRVEGSVNVQSLEKSLKDLLSELRQTQTPLALESDTMDSLTSRPNAQAVNQRVLHHNSELTNFVSRLTEEKMELRNTLGRLEEEIWRYMQKGAEQQTMDRERGFLNVRHQGKDEGWGSTLPLRTCSEGPGPALRSAARVVVAVTRSVSQTGHHIQECRLIGSVVVVQPRMRVRKWKRATRVGSPVMGGTVDLKQAPSSNSFSPPCIDTQSHLNGSGPFNSHASSPLHSSVHQPPCSLSYLSSSFTQRDLLNGASPYHSLGGASSGYHVNSNGVTNGISPYQSVGGVSDSYHVNGNISVHTTLPTRDYSCKPHPTSENSGATRKIIFPSSPTPTKVGHSSLIRRFRIRKASSHDDFISRLDSRICIRDSVGCILVSESEGSSLRSDAIVLQYSKIKVISLKIGVRSREPCYNLLSSL